MSLFENALQDLRFGARSLRKNPAITAIAALSLALGIGANTAIFSLIDTVLLKMLPVRHPQELVLVSDPGASGVSIGSQGGARSLFSCQEFEHIRDRQQVFDGMYAAESNAQRVSARIDGGPPENIRERLVSGAYFPVLGVEAAIGRTFTAQDDRIPRNAPYAVISYRFWTNRFGKSADVLGKSIRIHNAALTVIGVAPQSFFGETVGAAPDVWIPMMMQPLVYPGRDWLRDDEHSVERVMWLQVMGRLKPGVSLKQAQANISVVFQQILAGYEVPGLTAEQHKNQLDQKIELHPGARGASSLRDDYSKPLYVLMAVVGMVLLIACANIANLLLARATARQKEIAVRLAMGASRFRLGMQFLTESLLLSLFGGAVAVLIAGWGTRILLRVVSRGPETVPLVVHTDSRVLAFTAALAILTGILFGLAPALRATRLDAGPILKDNSRGVTGASRVTLGKVLVVAQIAISLLLLIGAGLFVRTLRNLRNVNLGYQPDKLVLFDIDALEAGYKGHAGIDLFNRVLAEIRTIPGVRTATFSQNGLFSGSESGTRVDVEGYKPAKDGPTGARFDQVGPDYFSSLGIPVLRGREIGRQDTANSTPVCVVNEAFVKDFFKGAEPLGKHIRDLFPGSKAPPFEIVGVVKDVRDHNLRGDIARRFYAPATQGVDEVPPFVNFEVRAFADPGSVIPAMRQRVRAIDSSLPPLEPRLLGELVDERVLQERIVAQLSTFFGALALLLAAVGLYGVLAYAVERRTNEIGLRMAIGAERGAVVWLVLRETLVLLATGLVIGGGASLLLARLVASSMYGVTTRDPLTMLAAAAALSIVAIAAATFPALRAAKIDPMVALRVE